MYEAMKSCIYIYFLVLITNDSVEGTELIDRRRNNNTISDGCRNYLGKSVEQYQLYIPADNICTECICKTTNTYCLRIPCANQFERNNFEFGDADCVFNCHDPDDPTNRFCYDIDCKLNKRDSKLMRVALAEGIDKSITSKIGNIRTSVGENGECRDYQGRHVKHSMHFTPLDINRTVLCICENGHASSCRIGTCIKPNDCQTVLMKDSCEYTCADDELNGTTRVSGGHLLYLIFVLLLLS